MGKAQGAPNAFLLCSICQGEGKDTESFLGKYLRFYLIFGKEQSGSNHTTEHKRLPGRHFPHSMQS